MATAQRGILTYTFASAHGYLHPSGRHLESITRKGVDGEAFWPTGRRSEPVAWQMVTLGTSKASLESLFDSYVTYMMGQFITFTDDGGTTFTPILVTDIRKTREVYQVLGSSDGTTTHILETTWTMRHVIGGVVG